MRRFCPLAAVFLMLALAGSGKAGEEYYLLMFSSQRTATNPNLTHTFATFVKVSWPTPGPRPPYPRIEFHTISWMPASLKVRVEALTAETGRNLDLPATLAFARTTEQRVSLWGPYRIKSELYAKAVQRRTELESGKIKYKTNDCGYRDDKVSNCIHGVSAIVDGPRVHVGSPGWGEVASFSVLRDLEPWVISKRAETWLIPVMGLHRYPLLYREWRSPRIFVSEPELKATYGPPRI